MRIWRVVIGVWRYGLKSASCSRILCSGNELQNQKKRQAEQLFCSLVYVMVKSGCESILLIGFQTREVETTADAKWSATLLSSLA